MNQSVRSHEVATDRILGVLLEAAKTVEPYSPSLDALTAQIETIPVPEWRPSNAAEQVFSQKHHEFLGEIVRTVSPKASGWSKIFSRGKTETVPSQEELSRSLLKLSRYLDDTALSLKTIAREEKAINGYLDQITVFQEGLGLFKNALLHSVSGQVQERLLKAVDDKHDDLLQLHAAYSYAKASYAMAKDSLQTSAGYARNLQEAITLNINTNRAGRQDHNLLIPNKDKDLSGQRRQGNRIYPAETGPKTPAEELALLASQVGQSLTNQKNAISRMEENTRGINSLSQPS